MIDRRTFAVTTLVLATGAGLHAAPGAGAAERPKLPGLRLGCEDQYGSVKELRSRPINCVVYSADQNRKRSADLHRLRWSRWRTSGATATGIECGFGARCANRSVRVKLSGYRRLRCSFNTYSVFTKVTVTYRTGQVKRLVPIACPNSDPD